MVLHRSGLKTGIDFAHFGVESAMAFKGTTGVDERIVHFNSKWVRKKEKDYIYIYICILCFCSNLSISDDINFLGDRSENRCEKWHFWSEIGSGFKEPRGKPPLRIPRSIPIPRRTVVKTFHELEWCYLLYPRFGIYAGGNKRIEFLIHKSWQIEKVIGKISLSPDRHLCFLLSCFY